eukprot:TRINITY_DN2326_c1_g2_i1.p2 TRINITY_DN2326_c1_g2~~TRINITY_DN2326_c1_g2_i1.p2  ORF type:complete len:249 (+),score=-5.51 TRINITY_DN2326_c1_g2_i1:860-1606(+)
MYALYIYYTKKVYILYQFLEAIYARQKYGGKIVFYLCLGKKKCGGNFIQQIWKSSTTILLFFVQYTFNASIYIKMLFLICIYLFKIYVAFFFLVAWSEHSSFLRVNFVYFQSFLTAFSHGVFLHLMSCIGCLCRQSSFSWLENKGGFRIKIGQENFFVFQGFFKYLSMQYLFNRYYTYKWSYLTAQLLIDFNKFFIIKIQPRNQVYFALKNQPTFSCLFRQRLFVKLPLLMIPFILQKVTIDIYLRYI